MILVSALTLFEKRGLTICQNFLLFNVEFTSKFAKCSFFGFFQEVYGKSSVFLYSFWDISVLSLKNLFLSLERFIITLWKFFAINLPSFALRYFWFTRACLFKIFMKILRKCWHSILLISCFNISLSSSALNLSLQNFR